MGARYFLHLVVLLIVPGMLLAGCQGWKTSAAESVERGSPDFPLEVSNREEPIENGSLVYAQVSDHPFEGTLNKVFYSGAPDAEVMQFFDESLLAVDGDFIITDEGAATYRLSTDHKTISITIRDGVNWHDGEPVKASDLLYAYELLGHPDYMGTRYTFMISNVEGMPAYHEGKAESISGIHVSDDDKTITITFKEATPSIMSGIWTSPVPRHYVGDVTKGEVTMEDIVTSSKIRSAPIGFGPYKVTKVVPGESVQYERYEGYWRGMPALESIVLKVVNHSSIVKAIESGVVDIASLPVDQYGQAKQLGNIELLADIELAYTYIGFKLGKWDAKKQENVTDPEAKLSDKRVRQAMWHAMNNEEIAKELYHHLQFPATTLIVPVFKTFHDVQNGGRAFDPEKAKALLDEAGYKDLDGDGFREDPDGKPFVLNFAAMDGGETAELIARWYIQNWGDVGLKVKLTDGRLHEMNSFYDRVQSDDPQIDLYQGAWGTGSDPDPSGLYGRSAMFNYSRFVSEENDRLLEAGTSAAAFDSHYRRKIYNEWQKFMVEEAPVAPALYRYSLTAVNRRVTNYSIDGGSDIWLYEMGVTEKKPIAGK